MKWTLEQARSAWAHGQGLVGPRTSGLAETVRRTGWIRTLGGAEAYLALAARATGVTVDAVHGAVGNRAIRVSPSVRGCIYLVPAADAGLSIRVAETLSRRRFDRDLEKAGIDPAELTTLGEAVLAAVADADLDTRALRKALPDDAIRSTGPAGKKVGLTSTLPPALRELEFAGRLVRQPVDGRLDHERYVWRVPDDDPLAGAPETEADLHAALAERFIRWAGPATRDELAAWSGLGKRASGAALNAADLVSVEVEGLGEAWVHPEVVDAELPKPDRVAWLPAMDNLLALHTDSARVVAPAGHDVEIPIFGYGGPKKLSDVSVPLMRTLARGGQVIGLWDLSDGTPVGAGFAGLDPDTAPPPEVAALLEALGHSKVTSIDNEASQARRLDVVRGLH